MTRLYFKEERVRGIMINNEIVSSKGKKRRKMI